MTGEFTGVWIPLEIWKDERLSPLEKIILCEIDFLSTRGTDCYASNQYLAKFCQCSESKISKAISKLIDLHFIIANYDGKTRHLKTTLAKNARIPSKKCQPSWQKMLHNNIDNNIRKNNIVKSNFTQRVYTNLDALFLN